MNEAKQVHRDLMNALLPILPRAVYQHIRRVVNLAWALVGLCMTHTVREDAWSEMLESHAHSAASRVRRFARWLHTPAREQEQWYAPILHAALVDWPTQTCLYVALDTTALTPFVLIRAS